MTQEKQGTPANDPARLCIAANMDIACAVAKQASANGAMCLIWSTEGPTSSNPGLLVPRIHEFGEKAPADLACVLSGYQNGSRITGAEVAEINRRLTWTDREKQRDRYKSAPDTPSARKKPGES